jgi:hypothetical protein
VITRNTEPHGLWNARTPVTWQCRKLHRWSTTSDAIKAGSWCPRCYAGKAVTIEDMRRLARSRRGACLSKRYANDRTKLLWRCMKRHTWEAPRNSIRSGSWCPTCAVENRRGSRKPVYVLEDMKALAARKGGTCRSRAYHGMLVPLRWRCAAGHTWEAQPSGIRRGTWCPECDRLKRMRKVHLRVRVSWTSTAASARRTRAQPCTTVGSVAGATTTTASSAPETALAVRRLRLRR